MTSSKHKLPHLVPPNDDKRIVMHSCCAPCSGELIETMLHSGIHPIIFFYNPNIHPKKEYEIRKNENIEFAQKHQLEFVDADYDTGNWFARTKGLEYSPERGERCQLCFDIRFERTAQFTKERGLQVFTSSLGISRWKNMAHINASGTKAAAQYPGLIYWTYNWRKEGGAERMYQIAKRDQMYKQEYCGCAYSLRDTNAWREKSGRPPIQIGTEYYQ